LPPSVVPFHVGKKIFIELVQVTELIRFFLIPIMPMVAFASFVIVPDKVLSVSSVVEPVLVSVTTAG
jgi:hypothetical protein